MAEIGTEGDKAPGDGISASCGHCSRARTANECLISWTCGVRADRVRPQPNRPGQLQKNGPLWCAPVFCRRSRQTRSHRALQPSSDSEAPIQGPLRRVMQRDELTFLNLVCRIIRPSGVNVLELQRQGFGDAQTCCGEEAEQRGIRPWSD